MIIEGSQKGDVLSGVRTPGLTSGGSEFEVPSFDKLRMRFQ
jgi:hypothetical protein